MLMRIATAAAVIAGVAGVVAAATAVRQLGRQTALAAIVSAGASGVTVVCIIAAAVIRTIDAGAPARGASRVARVLAGIAAPYLPGTGEGEGQSPWIEEWPAAIAAIPPSWHRWADVAWALCGFVWVGIKARAEQILDLILASDALSYTILGAGVVGVLSAMSLLRRIAPAIITAGPVLAAGVQILFWLRAKRGVKRGKDSNDEIG
jgi:hypothetical protein